MSQFDEKPETTTEYVLEHIERMPPLMCPAESLKGVATLAIFESMKLAWHIAEQDLGGLEAQRDALRQATSRLSEVNPDTGLVDARHVIPAILCEAIKAAQCLVEHKCKSGSDFSKAYTANHFKPLPASK